MVRRLLQGKRREEPQIAGCPKRSALQRNGCRCGDSFVSAPNVRASRHSSEACHAPLLTVIRGIRGRYDGRERFHARRKGLERDRGGLPSSVIFGRVMAEGEYKVSPGLPSNRQDGPAATLRVTYQDVAVGKRTLHTLGSTPTAVGGLEPLGCRGCCHQSSLLIRWTISADDSRSSACALRYSNANLYRSSSCRFSMNSPPPSKSTYTTSSSGAGPRRTAKLPTAAA